MSSMEHVARELGLLFRGLKGLHAATLADLGVRLEMPAAAVLATLGDAGQMRLSSLAEQLQVDLSSVSRQVAALEREGWIDRRRDPDDSRAALLALSTPGQELLDRLRAARVELLRRRLPDWSDEDLLAFAASLQRFRVDLTAPDASAAPALSGSAGR